MIRAELKKLISNRQILLLIVALLLVNTGLNCYQAVAINDEGYSARDVGRVFTEMGTDQAGYISDKLLCQNKLWKELIQNATTTGIVAITEDELIAIMTDICLYEYIQSEVQQTTKYGSYLADIEAEAQRLQGASLLYQTDSFSSRNILDLAEDYADLEYTVLSWSPSEGMELVTNNPLTDACILVCISIFVMLLTTSEREGGYHALIHTAPRGCSRTWFVKWLVLISAAVVLCILFYSMAFWVSWHLIGFGNFNQPVQSMSAYYSCPYELTIAQFLMVFFSLKVIAILGAATVLFCYGCFFVHNLWATISIGILVLVSCISWVSVNRAAWYGLLKEFNIVALLDTHHYLNNSVNVNFIGYPISTLCVGIVFFIMATGTSLPLSYWLWNRPTNTDRKKFWFNSRFCTKIKLKSLWRHEISKLMFTNHGLSISLIMIILLILVTSSPKHFDQTQYYYRQYADVLSGPLTKESQQFINNEAKRISNAELQILKLSENVSKGDLSEVAYAILVQQWEIPQAQRVAFEIVQNQYSYLLELQSKGVVVEFLDESSWLLITGVWGKSMSVLNAAWLAVLLTACIHNYWHVESVFRVTTLINCTAREPNRTKWLKYKVCLCYAILIAPIAFINELYLVNKAFPLQGWNSASLNVRSVYALGQTSEWCSIAGYLTLRILCIVAETTLCAWGVLAISGRVNNSLVAILLCTIIFGTEIMLTVLMGSPPFLSGRIHVCDALFMILCFFVVLVVLYIKYNACTISTEKLNNS